MGWLVLLHWVSLAWLVPVWRATGHTTLRGAWGWCLLVGLVWCGVATRSAVWPVLPVGLANALWYTAALLVPCPLIAVLGGKRPMSRVWSLFVVFPLVLVLAWPVVTSLDQFDRRAAWVLEEPMVAGYTLVLVMGVGNYLGTRNTWAVLAYGLAGLLAAWSACPTTARWLGDVERSRWLAQGLMLLVGPLAWWSARGTAGHFNVASAPQVSDAGAHSEWVAACEERDRLWRAFENLFGLVWSRRIQEAVNEQAEREGWRTRLTPHGFVLATAAPTPSTEVADGAVTSPAPAEAAEFQSTLRALQWWLRRFVDDTWLDTRLPRSRELLTHTSQPGASLD